MWLRQKINEYWKKTDQTVIAHLYTKFTVQSYVVREILHVSSFLINAQWAKNTIVFGKKKIIKMPRYAKICFSIIAYCHCIIIF